MAQLTPGQEGRHGTVRVRIVNSSNGTPVDATVTLANNNGEDLGVRLVAGSLLDIPYGTYSLRVKAKVWGRKTRTLTVASPLTSITVGLHPEAPVDGGDPTRISGKVISSSRPLSDVSIRLIAIYDDGVSETVSDSKGEFVFVGPDDGLYLVIASAENVHVTQVVNVRGSVRGITLQLP